MIFGAHQIAYNWTKPSLFIPLRYGEMLTICIYSTTNTHWFHYRPSELDSASCFMGFQQNASTTVYVKKNASFRLQGSTLRQHSWLPAGVVTPSPLRPGGLDGDSRMATPLYARTGARCQGGVQRKLNDRPRHCDGCIQSAKLMHPDFAKQNQQGRRPRATRNAQRA